MFFYCVLSFELNFGGVYIFGVIGDMEVLSEYFPVYVSDCAYFLEVEADPGVLYFGVGLYVFEVLLTYECIVLVLFESDIISPEFFCGYGCGTCTDEGI